MRDNIPIAAVDARTLVPVRDEAGGVVIYVGGRAAYYVLNGEWFAALAGPLPLVPHGEGRSRSTGCPLWPRISTKSCRLPDVVSLS